jgi:hypothetical protein
MSHCPSINNYNPEIIIDDTSTTEDIAFKIFASPYDQDKKYNIHSNKPDPELIFQHLIDICLYGLYYIDPNIKIHNLETINNPIIHYLQKHFTMLGFRMIVEEIVLDFENASDILRWEDYYCLILKNDPNKPASEWYIKDYCMHQNEKFKYNILTTPIEDYKAFFINYDKKVGFYLSFKYLDI